MTDLLNSIKGKCPEYNSFLRNADQEHKKQTYTQ